MLKIGTNKVLEHFFDFSQPQEIGDVCTSHDGWLQNIYPIPIFPFFFLVPSNQIPVPILPLRDPRVRIRP